MRLNYKKIGDYIRLVDERNRDLKISNLLGLTISKKFIPSVANTVGTNMANYKIIKKNQFACSLMQVRRDKKIPIAIYKEEADSIISQAYPMFEVKDEEELLPDYLMMWFLREEFDRESCFYAVGGVRGSVEWEDFCDMQFPLSSIEKQREIVKEYNVVKDRIELNNTLIQKLEETAQAIYRQWFVDFEFPDENGKPYKSSGGEMEWCEELEKEVPKGWEVKELGELLTPQKGKNITRSQVVSGDVPVVAGGISPSCYHNKSNTEAPVITISASGANAGFVRLYYKKIWSSDSSFIDKTITPYVYFIYVLLKLNQGEITHMQTGTGQPHIYPKHIKSLLINDIPDFLLEKFERMVTPMFQKIGRVKSKNEFLLLLKDTLLSKLATVTN